MDGRGRRDGRGTRDGRSAARTGRRPGCGAGARTRERPGARTGEGRGARTRPGALPGRARVRAPRPRARLVLALVLCLLAAACSWRHEETPAPGSAACHPRDDILRIATGSDLTGTGIRALLIQHWAEERNVPVRIVQLPDTADGQRSQLVASLQAGNPYCYDLVNLDVTWTAEFAAQRLITPVDPGGDDFWPAASKGVRYGDENWAVPWNTDVGLLFYRADLIGPGGLGTWDALTETVRNFRPERDRDVRAGLLTQLEPYEGLTVNAAEAVWRAGGEIVSGEGEKAKVTVDEPRATAGLLDLVKAVGDEESGPGLPVIGASSRHLNEQSSLESFLSGHALMLRDWPFAAVQLAQAEKRGTGENRPRYGVTQLPRTRTGGSAAALGGQNLAVVAGSGHDALARDLLAHLTSAGAERCLRDGGFVPARRSALVGECDAAKYVGGAAPHGTELPADFRRAYDRALRAALEDARPRPVTPYYAAVTREIQQRVDAMWEGDVRPFATELKRALEGR